MARVDIRKKLCLACGATQDGGLECFGCGATALESGADERNKRPPKWYQRPPRQFVAANAILAAGVAKKWPTAGVVVVTGEPGAGKTTLVLEALVELHRQGRICAVFDAEMADELAKPTWQRAGISRREMAKIRRETPETDTWTNLTKSDANVVLIDSLHEWTIEGGKQVAVDCGRRSAWARRALLFVVAHYARAGHVHGSVVTDHRADAILVVTHEQIEVQKCTWAPKGAIITRR